MAVRSFAGDLKSLLGHDTGAGLASPAASLSTVHLLHHFQSTASTTLGDSTVQQIMHSHVSHSAWEQPYVMHMLLAVSSAHLKRLAPASNTPEETRLSAVAEAEHWQNGLSLYRAALAAPATRSKQNVDALIGTTFLSVIFAFALEDQIAPDAFLTEYDKSVAHVLIPMAAGSGIIALNEAVRMHDSIAWMPVLRKGNDRCRTYTSQLPGIDGLPPALVRVCALDELSSSANNEYHSILRMLTPLLRLERSVEHFTKLIAFGGRSFSLFRPLLQRRDAKALLLLSYWIALLLQLDQWWLNDTAIHALLPFPASCGYGNYEYLWK
ncbi:hypothetical protein B0A55_12314 [Friedmanniomyces simplex]|uniref:Transcription factor domain-containing protein n=1 Tax=Friedmanniomyces simplex TaxID=329884 RepID=A0A4U0WKJ1_9PEZI|nr:hypothetical protein B0A55_12314 [Friedmanniomyces simplex]